MANKKTKINNQAKASESREKRRIKTMQILFVVFSAILILSMVLSLASK
jgi:predicted nucleic acid-binding Zn ribbon protein